MTRKKISPNNQTKSISKNNRRSLRGVSLPLRYRLLMLVCGLLLIAGFFFAARQHFSLMDFNMKNSRLRKVSEELESDKRRLLLAKEIALSPFEIKKAAQKIGFTQTTPSNAEVSRPPVTSEKPEKSEPAKIKQAIVNKANEVIANVKSVVKKVSGDKSPDAKTKKEPSQPLK
ncbi:MAG: hypothetical protein ACR2L1_07670 [Pyrinomonadaceae bacterium]